MKVGINGVYKDLDKMWVGINGVWKEVEKMFTNIDGVWKEVEGLQKILKYLGIITNSSVALYSTGAAASTNTHAIFMEGQHTRVCVVNAYDVSLTRSIPSPSSGWAMERKAVSTSDRNYALFAGGWSRVGDPGAYEYYHYKTVNYYNISLTRNNATDLSAARYLMGSSNVGNYALFAGGYTAFPAVHYDTVDAYDNSLVRNSPSPLSVGRRVPAGASTQSHALFAGGTVAGTTHYRNVDAYDASLTRSSATALSIVRQGFCGGSTFDGKHAIFAGGLVLQNSAWIGTDIVESYNQSLTRTTITPLSIARTSISSTSIDDYVIFAGGGVGTLLYSAVDAYDNSLVRTLGTNLDGARASSLAATIGNYALFAGGTGGEGSYSTIVSAYTSE